MMYQLLVNTNLSNNSANPNLSLSKWEELDIGNDVIAITYQANNIAELKSRQANRSNTVTLPRTANNDRIFALACEPNSASRYPYHYLDAYLYHNGVELFGVGSKLRLIEANSNGYKIAIYGGLFDLFAKMKERKLRDMNLGCVAWNTAAIANGIADRVVRTNEEGNPILNADGDFETEPADYISFPLVDWDANDPSYTFVLNEGSTIEVDEEVEGSETSNLQDKNVVTVRSQYILPAIRYKWLCERVLAEHGYQLVLPTGGIDEVLNDHRYLNAVMPFARMESSNTDLEWCTTKSVAGGTLQSLTGSKRYVFNSISGCFTGYRAHTDYYNPSRCRPRFVARATGTYVFEYSIRVPQNSSCYINFETSFDSPYNSQGTSERVISRGAVHQQPVTGTRVVELRQNQAVEFSFDSEKGTMQAEISIRCAKATFDGPVFPSTALPVALNLPDLTQADLITTLARLWCLVPVLDERQRQLRFFSFDTLYENLQNGSCKDWSRKLDDREHRTSFRWNTYAQANTLKYKEDEGCELANGEKKKVTSEAVFALTDYTLDYSKNLFELPFYACEEKAVLRADIKMAKIRAIEQGDTSSMSEASPKLLYLQSLSLNRCEWNFVDPRKGEDSKVQNELQNKVQIASFNQLDMERFLPVYATLINGLLTDTRVVVEKLWLQPGDLQGFDHSVPVYLSKYSCSFYVNKVGNFTPGRLTGVELVALRPYKPKELIPLPNPKPWM